MTVLRPLALGSCLLTVFAMGRGGTCERSIYGQGGGGGGSGFLEWNRISFVGLTQISTISWPSTGTTVFMEDDKDFLSARPGGQGGNSVGGDGYSGGGCSSDGGRNGSNISSFGSYCRAGKGSGLLLEDIPVNSFTLTSVDTRPVYEFALFLYRPGAPGKGTQVNGGGGGGILVDGKGPTQYKARDGEGYGAGGGTHGFVILDYN